MSHSPLFRPTAAGLFCEAGEFFVDPLHPVSRAVITHAHADHLRRGSREYLTARAGERVVRTRLGNEARLQTLEYGETLDVRGVKLSLHPAGHILGSAQVRAEYRGEVWVVSGDYKVRPDPTCAAFELLRCHTFVTESTFALPTFVWPEAAIVYGEINDWWRENQRSGKASVLFAYALGKAQRVLAGVDPTIGPIYSHGAVAVASHDYRESGVALPPACLMTQAPEKVVWSQALVIAPPSAKGTGWLRRFGDHSSGFASGWMCLPHARQRRGMDRGFILSDHADWPHLLAAIQGTGAERVLAAHGYVMALVRHLRGLGIDAAPLEPRPVDSSDDHYAFDPAIDSHRDETNEGELKPRQGRQHVAGGEA